MGKITKVWIYSESEIEPIAKIINWREETLRKLFEDRKTVDQLCIISVNLTPEQLDQLRHAKREIPREDWEKLFSDERL